MTSLRQEGVRVEVGVSGRDLRVEGSYGSSIVKGDGRNRFGSTE